MTRLFSRLVGRLPQVRELRQELDFLKERQRQTEARRDTLEARVDTLLKQAAERSGELDRTLEELQAVSQEKALLADRLEQALNDRARVWDVMKEALDGERTAYQLVINIDHQKQYGIAPYPGAPKLPENRVPQQHEGGAVNGRMTPSQAVHRASSKFVNDFVDRVKEDLKR